MAFTIMTKPTLGTVVKKAAFADQVIDNLNDLNARMATVTTVAIPNGSFEIESSTTGVPEGWTWTAYHGTSAIALDTTAANVASGAKSVKITHPGGATGGGYLASTDYIPVNPSEVRFLEFWLKNATANVVVQVYIDYYTEAFGAVSSTTAYNSSSAVASLTKQTYVDTTPATAAWAKIRLVGGHTSGTTAGDTYFDSVAFEPGLARRLLTATSNTAAQVGTSSMSMQLNASADPTVSVAGGGAQTIWHAGNDGPASGLNADLLDGRNSGGSSGNVPYNDFSLVHTDLISEYVSSLKVTIAYASSIATIAVPAGATTTITITSTTATKFYIPSAYVTGSGAATTYPTMLSYPGIVGNIVWAFIEYDDDTADGIFLRVYNGGAADVDVVKAVLTIG
jgi:hypothetical protein